MRWPESPTRWAMALCVVGGLAPLGPWATTAPWTDLASWVNVTIGNGGRLTWGFDTLHGCGIAIGHLALLACLIAFEPLRPVPWWRTLLLALTGLGTLVAMLHYGHTHWVSTWAIGGVVGVITSVGLILVASFEVRARLLRRQSQPSSPNIDETEVHSTALLRSGKMTEVIREDPGATVKMRDDDR